MSTNNNILVEELRILGEEFRNKFSIHHLPELAYQTGMIQRKRKFQAQDLVSLCVFLGQTISSESFVSLCTKLNEATGTCIAAEALNKTIDEEGMLWIAHWGGSKVSRWNPKSGKQLLTIPIPALYVTSCTFGGSNLNELYITTARMNNTNPEIYPNAGGIFRMKTNIKGCPTYQFNS